MTEKPRHRSGYTSEETELVRSACLTVAVTLGAYLDDVVIVGGLVPSLLIDTQRGEPSDADEDHPGTNDLEVAFNERSQVTIVGTTLAGEEATREVPVCGPGAFIVLKAFAFADRSEPKDAFDLVYVIRGTPGGAAEVAATLRAHAATYPEIVDEALALLARDFDTPAHLGPRRAADAHGYVDDLIKAYRG